MAENEVLQTGHGKANIAFTYLKTPIEAGMIRLLTVNDDDDSLGLLHCSLSTARLDDLPKFIALSYTWGQEEATQEIFVNSLRFMVRRNLYDFLHTVATKSIRGELLFIDAICIDQSNIEERESQIPHMRDIYSKASRVIAWLGLADGVLSERLANVQESLASIDNSTHRALLSDSLGEEVLSRLQTLVDETDRAILGQARGQANHIGDHSADLDLRVDLLNPGGFSFSYDRPFWKRVWIVQEIILAQHLTIQVGHHAISPEDYLLGITRRAFPPNLDTGISMRSSRPEGKRIKPAKGLLLDREYWRKRLHEGPPIQLYEIIVRFGFQHASEPLDHVFGFLGLAQTQVRADYHLTRIELYTYVLIEGAQQFNKPKVTRKDVDVLQMFHYACLSAFGYSATDATIAAISERALGLNSIPVHVRIHVALVNLFFEQIDDIWDNPRRGHSIHWSVILAQVLWALGSTFTSYARLCISRASQNLKRQVDRSARRDGHVCGMDGIR